MPKTVQQLVAEKFGQPVYPQIDPEITSVGTTAARLLRNDPHRLGFVITCTSSSTLYGLPQPLGTPSSTLAYFLLPGVGSQAFLWWEEDVETVAWEWLIVASAAATTFTTIAYSAVPD